MRLFVGIWLEPAARAALAAMVDRPDDPTVRWTAPEAWHVTLRFLGELEGTELGMVIDVLSAALVEAPTRTMQLGPATARLGTDVLVVPAAGIDDLGTAATWSTRHLGRPPEDRPFRGHLTVARRAARARRIAASLVGWPVSVRSAVTDVALIRSRSGAGGAGYETVATFPLRPAR